MEFLARRWRAGLHAGGAAQSGGAQWCTLGLSESKQTARIGCSGPAEESEIERWRSQQPGTFRDARRPAGSGCKPRRFDSSVDDAARKCCGCVERARVLPSSTAAAACAQSRRFSTSAADCFAPVPALLLRRASAPSMALQPPAALLFDVNGTLFPADACAAAFRRAGLPGSAVEVRAAAAQHLSSSCWIAEGSSGRCSATPAPDGPGRQR